jgi:hypothetical protein
MVGRIRGRTCKVKARPTNHFKMILLLFFQELRKGFKAIIYDGVSQYITLCSIQSNWQDSDRYVYQRIIEPYIEFPSNA